MASPWAPATTWQSAQEVLRNCRFRAQSQSRLRFDTGSVTFAAFVTAGSLPLLAYLLPVVEQGRFTVTAIFGALSLFVIGAARTLLASGSWWINGLEMLGVGGVAATLAFFVGSLVSGWTAAGS